MLSLTLFRKQQYQTLNQIHINQTNLLNNYHDLSSLSKLKIAPVLKSNAYGHGITLVAKILAPQQPPFLCVDSLYEAYQLLKAGLKTPILIMGYTVPQNFTVKKLPFKFAVYDLETAKVLNEYQPGAQIHLFVDTGMNREGIPLSELPEFLQAMKQLSNLTIDGLMSHFASADNAKNPANLQQIANFKQALEIVKSHGFNPRWIHLANSDGLLNFHQQLGFTNIARTGIALYGITSIKRNVLPILTLTTKIAQIKTLKKGESVGYSGTYTAKKDLTIGILPIGYNDGVDRRLSNQGVVTINGKICKILGRVSMNITTIDLSTVPDVHIGDEVVVFSNNPQDLNSIQNAAQICETIPYELLVHLDSTIKRVII